MSARKIISSGGAHVTMPVWGKILTPEQLDALVQYTLTASKGKGTEEGAQLFATNCSACHGQFGQGGPNPARPGDIIPPISSAEFLGTRDDTTLRNIVSQGQPDLGMNPFGSAYGGPLTDDQVDSVVAFVRGWQANPPQDRVLLKCLRLRRLSRALTAEQIFESVCAQCHGANGEGGSGPALNTPEFQAKYDDQTLSNVISEGIPSTPMIGVGGDVLPGADPAIGSSDQEPETRDGERQYAVRRVYFFDSGSAHPSGQMSDLPQFRHEAGRVGCLFL